MKLLILALFVVGGKKSYFLTNDILDLFFFFFKGKDTQKWIPVIAHPRVFHLKAKFQEGVQAEHSLAFHKLRIELLGRVRIQ